MEKYVGLTKQIVGTIVLFGTWLAIVMVIAAVGIYYAIIGAADYQIHQMGGVQNVRQAIYANAGTH